MSEIPGPTPEKTGIETERSVERQPIHELVEIITSRRRAAMQEVENSGQWPLPMRDLVKVREQTLIASLPTDYDVVKSVEDGWKFLEILADDPEGIYRFTTASNEGKRSLRQIVEALPEGQLTPELVISARDLRVEGDRREADYPHHLSISTDDFIRLHERVKWIRLFVETYPTDGLPEPHLVTLDLRSLGLVSLDHTSEHSPPNKMLIIPYDYFVESDDGLDSESPSQLSISETIARADSSLEVEPRENEPTAGEVTAVMKELYIDVFDEGEIMAIEEEFVAEYGEEPEERFDRVCSLIYSIALEHGIAEEEFRHAMREKGINLS